MASRVREPNSNRTGLPRATTPGPTNDIVACPANRTPAQRSVATGGGRFSSEWVSVVMRWVRGRWPEAVLLNAFDSPDSGRRPRTRLTTPNTALTLAGANNGNGYSWLMRAADALMEALKAEGVEHVFGIPGGANLPTYDALYDADLMHVQARHEQGAGHMAEGYAKSSGKVGVAMATSGPGATNLVTAIADAMMDSVPTVFITGQVRTDLLGTDGFQEADVNGITMPVVKHSFMVQDPRYIPEYVHAAFHIASTGRPGPVLVDIPQDLSRADIDYEPSTDAPDLPGYKPSTEGNIKQIRIAAKAIANAARPILYTGGGVINGNASEELREFVRSDNFPITSTLMGLGAFPAPDDQWLGMLGHARHPRRQLRDGRGRPDRLHRRPLR